MKGLIFCAMLGLATLTMQAQPMRQGPAGQPGEAAPLIKIKEWLNTDKAVKLQQKPMLIDFWATWCGPCRAAIPHMNELAKEFKGKMDFLSLTAEDRAKVDPFLKTTTFESYVVTDFNRETSAAWGISGIPHIVIIDAKGIVIWRGHPSNLNREMIDNFLKTGKI